MSTGYLGSSQLRIDSTYHSTKPVRTRPKDKFTSKLSNVALLAKVLRTLDRPFLSAYRE